MQRSVAISDGTTCIGEALAIVLHFISKERTVEKGLVCLQILAKSLSGEEIAREVISCPSVTLWYCYRSPSSSNERQSVNQPRENEHYEGLISFLGGCGMLLPYS